MPSHNTLTLYSGLYKRDDCHNSIAKPGGHFIIRRQIQILRAPYHRQEIAGSHWKLILVVLRSRSQVEQGQQDDCPKFGSERPSVHCDPEPSVGETALLCMAMMAPAVADEAKIKSQRKLVELDTHHTGRASSNLFSKLNLKQYKQIIAPEPKSWKEQKPFI